MTVIIEFKFLSVNLIDDYCAKSIVLQIESIFRFETNLDFSIKGH